MSIEFIVIIWLYVFGFIGIYATQAVAFDDGKFFRKIDWPSFSAMLAWPITVPLFALLATYDAIRGR